MYVSLEICIFAALNLIDMESKLSESAPLLPLAACLMTGIIMGSRIVSPVQWWFLLVGAVVLTLLLYRMPRLQSVGIAICMVLLGATRMQHQSIGEKHPQSVIQQKPLSRIDRSRAFFLQQRTKLLQRFVDGGMDNDAYAVVAAMALGDKSALTKELKETYAVTGASHVLALSGLHLGIIYMLLSLILKGRRWRMIAQLLTIIAVWTFVFLVGMSVSVVRAAVMLSVYALLSLGHRDKMSVNTLAFTAIVMLMVNPRSLFDIGFQMSFMAVLSILLWMPVFESIFGHEWLMEHRLFGWFWGMVGVSMSAQAAVAPLIAYYFGRFSCYFLFTNFIVVPAATLILWLAPLVLLLPSCAYLLLYIVNALNAALSWLAALPGATIDNLHPTVLQVMMVYIIIGAVWLLIRKTSPTKGW